MVIVAFIFDLRTLQVVWCTCTTLCKLQFLSAWHKNWYVAV